MLYIFAHVLQNGWIPGERDKCKHGSWPRKKPAKQFKRKSLAETAELTESTIISLAWAGGKKITQAAGPGTPGRSTTENWEAGTSHRRASVCGSNPVRGLEEVAMKRVSERRSKMTAWSQTQQFAGSSQQTIFGDPTFLVPFSLFWTVPR